MTARENWRRRAERAERDVEVLRAEIEKARRLYGDHLAEIVALKIALSRVRGLLDEALEETNV